MDLERGYHQVIVHKDSVSKTAFITPHGKWEYVRMPFDLKNASSVFLWLMNSVLVDMASFAAAHIDDNVIYSTNFEEHLNHLEAVFTRLEGTGLSLKHFFLKLSCTKLPVSWTHGWSRRCKTIAGKDCITHAIPQTSEEDGHESFPGTCKLL